MTNKLFTLLTHVIPISFVSVSNSQNLTSYSFHIPNEPGEDTLVKLTSSYAYTGPKNIYAKYQLYLDEELIATATRPVINDKKIPFPKLTGLTPADQLETLLYMCSLKVIQQEYDSHITHMLKTFNDAKKSYTC